MTAPEVLAIGLVLTFAPAIALVLAGEARRHRRNHDHPEERR